MKAYKVQPIELPLPAWVLHPFTALLIALMHVYLAAEHLLKLFGGEMTWTTSGKGSAHWEEHICSQRWLLVGLSDARSNSFGQRTDGRKPIPKRHILSTTFRG